MSDPSHARRDLASLVLVPGLGADAELYRPQVDGLGRQRVLVTPLLWPTSERETIESYARRLAAWIAARPEVSRPYFIGGLSLGGIIAAEVAECCGEEVAGLLLIGACLRASEIPVRWKVLALLGQHVPDGLGMAGLNRLAPAIIARWQELGPPEAELFQTVYSRASVRHLKWAANAMRRWDRHALPRCPVYRAHGARDDIVPLREEWIRPGIDLVVPDGRHLISLTHAQAVNRWMLRVMRPLRGSVGERKKGSGGEWEIETRR